MKKTLRMKFMLLLFALVVGIGNAWADVITITCSDVSSTTSYSTTAASFTNAGYGFSYTNAMINNSNGTPPGWAKQQVIQTKNGTIYNTSPISGLQNIRVYLVANTNTFTITSGSSQSPTTNSVTRPTTATGTESITYSAYTHKEVVPNQTTTASYYDFDLSQNNASYFKIASGSNAVYIWKIVVTYTSGGGSTPSINANNVNIAYSATSGSISYSIDNAPNPAGTLTAAIKAGTTSTISSFAFGTITSSAVPFTCDANNSYLDRSATVTLTYTYGNNATVTKDVVVTQPSNYGNSTNPYTVAQAIAVIDAAGKTTVSGKYVTGIVSQVDNINSNAITYWISDDGTTTDQFEVYKGKSFNAANFSAVSDIQVGDVVVVHGDITYYSNSSVYEFAAGSSITSLKLVAPAIYPASGAVGSGTEVTLSTLRTGATFYYTTNGDNPTTSSTAYNSSSKPTITTATTFKAIAVKSGCTNSDVATASYTLLTPVATPEITLAGGTYSYAQTTTITCDTDEATIYYTTNGSNPTTSSTPYTGPISINETMTIKAIAAKSGMANSAVATATYTINIPVINASNVNIACDATSGSIPYTITNPDGGNLTAAITSGNEGSWLTLGSVGAESVAFTCTANTTSSNRTATVTLTYTYQTNQTVTKTVTVTQAGYFPTPTSDDYVRISSLDQLVDGCIVIIAARYDGNSNKYYAMTNSTTGKPSGVSFTSETNNDNGNEILPESLLIVNEQNVQANYYWVVNTTENGYTFTKPNNDKDKIGYTSSTSFATNGNNTEWTIEVSTSAQSDPMVANYTGFLIKNYNNTSRAFALNDSYNYGPYSTGNMTGNDAYKYNFYLDFFVQMPTYQLDIDGHESSGHDWYLIAPPVAFVTPTEDNGFLTSTAENYDLYRFNQSADAEWENYKAVDGEDNPLHPDFTTLVNGKGYLYANANDVTLYFTGHPYKGDGVVALSYDDNAKLAGYNLIGNPFNSTAYLADKRDFYRMNEEGSGVIINTNPDGGGNAIAAFEGILVIAEDEDDNSVIFQTTEPATSTGNNNSMLNITVSQAKSNRGKAVTVDAARIRFGEGKQLPKFQLFENSTKLYIPQGDNDFAVVRGNAQGDMPLNFKAKELGTYTISFEGEEMDLNGIYLIDMLDEVEIDLSTEPSYTFIGSPADRSARFKIVFKNNGNDSTSDIFAYQSGSDIVVSGEGELQIFDVMGRMVARQNVNGVQTINAMAHGVYIFKLNEKTQKIIVK